jgi:protein-tyrosine phosphatase
MHRANWCFRVASVFAIILCTCTFTLAGGLAGASNSLGPVDLPGVAIKNFGVVDGHIFRGAQPRGDDYVSLANMGVTTVIDLRLDAKSNSRELAEAAGLRYVNIPIDDHGAPTDADAAAFIRLLDQARGERVYVHCAGGRHRTGSMIAVYRIVRDGWTVQQAYDEMLAYDFYTARGHGGFKKFVFDFYDRLVANPSALPAVSELPAGVADGLFSVAP